MTIPLSGRDLFMFNRLPLLIATALLASCAGQPPTDDSYARFMSLAGDLQKRGDTTTAASLYEKATQQPGSHVEAWLKLGETRLASGDARGAERAYQQALELKPGDVDALLGLGTTQVRLGKLDRAVTALTQAANTGNRADAWNRLGIAEILRGQAPAAQSAFSKSVALAPNDLDSRCNLALAYALGGQAQQALDTIHSVAQSPRAQPRHQRNELLITVLAGREQDVAGMTLEDIPAAERQTLLIEARRIKGIADPAVQARELGLVDAH
jgi:Flp pilus assembly protein TadD